MRRGLYAVAVVLSCLAAAQVASAQLSTVLFQGTYRGLSPYVDWFFPWLPPSQKCLETQPFYGSEPAAAGRYPVVIYLHATLSDWSNNVEGQKFVQLAAAYGFEAAAFSYDSWATLNSPTEIGLHANCMFNTASPGNAIAQICARPKANCTNGFVVAGFSQGGAIAARAKNFNASVQGVWALGIHGPSIPEMIATPTGTRVLPNNRLRINVGQGDLTNEAGQSDLSGPNSLTGQSCTTFNCLQTDGSGYYVVSNSEVSSGAATHCYWFVNSTCSLWPTFDPTFVSGTTPWSLSTNLSFLAGLLAASIVQTGPTPQHLTIVRQPKIPVHPVVLDAAGKPMQLPMTIEEYARAHGANVNQLLDR